MPRSQVIFDADDGSNFVTAEPEEVEVLESAGVVARLQVGAAGDVRVSDPFSLDDVKDSLREMRHPDVV